MSLTFGKTEELWMNYYQELTFINGDKSLYDIWSIVYTQLHIALSDLKNNNGIDSIGVSFPNYKYESKNNGKEFAMLGNKLRIFAPSQAILESFNLRLWLEKVNTEASIRAQWQLSNSFDINDYIHLKSTNEVGDKATGYVSVHRYRFKPMDVQAKSLAKKLNVSHEDAMATVGKRAPEKAVPYVQMRSQTNRSSYTLKVLQLPCNEPIPGSFNTYGMNGMSDHITVPHW